MVLSLQTDDVVLVEPVPGLPPDTRGGCEREGTVFPKRVGRVEQVRQLRVTL